MGKYKLGLTSVKVGAIAGDGGMGLTMSAVGDTVAGTAKLETTEATLTDFTIEESSSPIMSIKTEADKIAVSWSTYANDADTLVKFFGGTKVNAVASGILALGAITPGSAYTVGTYYAVPLTGGTGTGATADVTVTGGAVTAVLLRAKGSGYTAGASLSVAAGNVGGTGTGFSIVLTSVADIGEVWKAPDAIPEIELSILAEWKSGGYIAIPRAKVNAKLSMAFNKAALSQIDITASVLQPTKSGEPRMSITNGA